VYGSPVALLPGCCQIVAFLLPARSCMSAHLGAGSNRPSPRSDDETRARCQSARAGRSREVHWSRGIGFRLWSAGARIFGVARLEGDSHTIHGPPYAIHPPSTIHQTAGSNPSRCAHLFDRYILLRPSRCQGEGVVVDETPTESVERAPHRL
jgi:hypothetical protein